MSSNPACRDFYSLPWMGFHSVLVLCLFSTLAQHNLPGILRKKVTWSTTGIQCKRVTLDPWYSYSFILNLVPGSSPILVSQGLGLQMRLRKTRVALYRDAAYVQGKRMAFLKYINLKIFRTDWIGNLWFCFRSLLCTYVQLDNISTAKFTVSSRPSYTVWRKLLARLETP